MKERICPICEIPLEYQDFCKTNGKKFNHYWNNDSVAIPCCRCFEIILTYQHTDTLPFQFPLAKSLAWTILTNLVRFGLITEEKRDTTYQEFRKFSDSLKMRQRMNHLLL